MHQAVEDRIRHGRVADRPVPAVGRQLRGQHRRAQPVAVVADVEEVAALQLAHRRQREVVDHQPVDARQLGQQALQAVGRSRGLQVAEELRGACVQGAETVAAGAVRQGARQIALADPGRSHRQHVLFAPHPGRLVRHAREASPVQPARLPEIDLLQLLPEGFRHAVQAHRVQVLQSRLDQHGAPSAAAAGSP